MKRIVNLYMKDPEGIRFRVVAFGADLLASVVLQLLAYVRVLKLSQGGSYARTLKVAPDYVIAGLSNYIYQFRAK